MRAATYRRAEPVDLNGLTVNTYLDESQEVMVDLRDLIEKIGIDREEEAERMSSTEGLEVFRRCCIGHDFCYKEGLKTSSLFIPLRCLNDYLYSIPMREGPVGGNLQEFRAWFVAEAVVHWMRIKGTPMELSGLDMRELLLRESALELAGVIRQSDLNLEWVSGYVSLLTIGRNVPTNMMTSRERDLVHCARSLAVDVLKVCIEQGYSEEEVRVALRNTIPRHLTKWDF